MLQQGLCNYTKKQTVIDFKNRLQENCKVTRITLAEAILLLYCRRLIDVFVFLGTSMCNRSEELWEKRSSKNSRNFQKNILSSSSSFFMPKQQPAPPEQLKKMVLSPLQLKHEILLKGTSAKTSYSLILTKVRNELKRPKTI